MVANTLSHREQDMPTSDENERVSLREKRLFTQDMFVTGDNEDGVRMSAVRRMSYTKAKPTV